MKYINPTTTYVNIDEVNVNSKLANGYWGPDLYPHVKPTPGPGPEPIQSKPLTFKCTSEEGGTVQLLWQVMTGSVSASVIDMEVSVNNDDWRPYNITRGRGEIIHLSKNDTVSFRGNNETLGNIFFDMLGIDEEIQDDTAAYWTFIFNGYVFEITESDDLFVNQNGNIEASGNIMSLLDKTMQRTDVPKYAFLYMFVGAKGLATAPEFPATTLTPYCYTGMFCYCLNLTTAPELPATTLAKACYAGMFVGSGLTTGPNLPAKELIDGCYFMMFSSCNNLTSLTVQADVIQGRYCLDIWLVETAENTYGILHYDGETDYTPYLPENWYVNEILYAEPLTFKGLSSENSVALNYMIGRGTPVIPELDIEVSVNGGEWIPYIITEGVGETISFAENETVAFRGDNETLGSVFSDNIGMRQFRMTGTIEASGSIMSLLNKTYAIRTISESYMFAGLFGSCTSLTVAPALSATNLSDGCYFMMFVSCTSLITAPELPALDVQNQAYYQMFMNCTSLTSAPELPATTLESGCYCGMFIGCTSLTSAPELVAENLNNACYMQMFLQCTALTSLTIHANDISPENCIAEWLMDTAVDTTGTLINKGTAIYTPGDNIPENWEVTNADNQNLK